jgi:hypothetical protein
MAIWYDPIWLINPPFSTTPSAPTRTMSTLSITYPTAASKIMVVGIPAARNTFADRMLFIFSNDQKQEYHKKDMVGDESE